MTRCAIIGISNSAIPGAFSQLPEGRASDFSLSAPSVQEEFQCRDCSRTSGILMKMKL